MSCEMPCYPLILNRAKGDPINRHIFQGLVLGVADLSTHLLDGESLKSYHDRNP